MIITMKITSRIELKVNFDHNNGFITQSASLYDFQAQLIIKQYFYSYFASQ